MLLGLSELDFIVMVVFCEALYLFFDEVKLFIHACAV